MKPVNVTPDEMAMQVPLTCPGTPEKPMCGTNVFEALQVVAYTRHRLKTNDRKFDRVVPVGSRFRCVGCGRVLDQADFNSPSSAPPMRLV